MEIHFSRLTAQHSFETGVIDLYWVDDVPVKNGIYKLVRNNYAHPLDVYDGDVVYEGTNLYYKDSNTEGGILYCYTLFIEVDNGDDTYTYYTSTINKISILGPYDYDYTDFIWKNLVWHNFKRYDSSKALQALFHAFGVFLGNIKSKLKQVGDIYRLKTPPIELIKTMYPSRGLDFTDNLPVDFYCNELLYCLQGMKTKGTPDGIVDYIFYLTNFELKISFTSIYRRGFFSCEYNGSITFDPDIHRVQDFGTHRDILRRTIDYTSMAPGEYFLDSLDFYIFIPFNTYRHTFLYDKVVEIINEFFPLYIESDKYPMFFSYAVLDKETDNLIEYTLS